MTKCCFDFWYVSDLCECNIWSRQMLAFIFTSKRDCNLCLLILQHDKTISIKLYQNKATTFSKNTVTRQHLISFLKGVLHSDRITLVSLIYQTILVKTSWNSPHFFHKPVHKQQKFSHSPHITMLCGLLASELNFVNGGRDEQDFLMEFQ